VENQEKGEWEWEQEHGNFRHVIDGNAILQGAGMVSSNSVTALQFSMV